MSYYNDVKHNSTRRKYATLAADFERFRSSGYEIMEAYQKVMEKNHLLSHYPIRSALKYVQQIKEQEQQSQQVI